MSTQIGFLTGRATLAHHRTRGVSVRSPWRGRVAAAWARLTADPSPTARTATPRHESYALGLGLAPAPRPGPPRT